MRLRGVAITLVIAMIAVALVLAACGGGEDGEATTTGPPPAAETPGGSATPPSAGALPPELLECFADEGFEIESPTEIHSAPQPVVQKCFGLLHQSG